MSYTITCPICGKRDLYEFRFGNEERGPYPNQKGLTPRAYSEAVQMHEAVGGIQKEWWYHRDGCGVWFTTWRDTLTGREVLQPEETS
ncbi:MAG TPA: sarcosine oxidase subunit delta [Desulfobacteraceae bacterium]|nr:sarcosine oxidase subunit delta [Deltaproteobacteria bacterium]HDM09019.1 sarcosine oxidase subunit delta [Desulfobacteraceae bacterium]